MPNVVSLSGTWIGAYYQHDRACPITAQIEQSGEVLTGSMRDGELGSEMSVADIASSTGEAPGADERIVARLREMFPDSPAAPVRYVTRLPPESRLEGRVQGSGVYFLKSYRGKAFGGYRIGDREVGRETEDHAVHYSGRLAPGGDEIEGRWWIDPGPEPGSRRTEGDFVLKRRSDAPRAQVDAASTAEPVVAGTSATT
jgi:hypothetical protein